MLKEGKADLNARRKSDGKTALLIAAEMKWRFLVDAFIDNGANYNATDKDGKGVEDFMPGLKEEQRKRQIPAVKEKYKGLVISPLQEAAKTGNVEDVSILLLEIDVNAADKYGYTPLHWALIKGHTNIVNLLKAKGGVRHF